MQQPSPARRSASVPSFYLTARQPLRPGTVILAIVTAVAALSAVTYGMEHSGHLHLSNGGAYSNSATTGSAADDKDDDPSQIDTIVLGDPADPPAPARRGDHVSPVHPTIVVRLPRFGDQVGLIPNSPAGHLLYDWLAAFNQASYPALCKVLPTSALDETAGAQMLLRHSTGGYNLLSAKEVQPGILVFRLQDQTPAATETLGTLVMRSNSNPPAASFSLRDVP